MFETYYKILYVLQSYGFYVYQSEKFPKEFGTSVGNPASAQYDKKI